MSLRFFVVLWTAVFIGHPYLSADAVFQPVQYARAEPILQQRGRQLAATLKRRQVAAYPTLLPSASPAHVLVLVLPECCNERRRHVTNCPA